MFHLRPVRYLKLPILRNRTSSFLLGESDFDLFGPGSAGLPPPEEMTRSDIDGRNEINDSLRIDALQNFPVGGNR
jgi:hypothetical protein